MRIYVATKWEEKDRAREVMADLRHKGHTITYDWTRCEQFSAEQARNDVMGVMTADALVLIAEKPLAYKGAYVEFGIAVARNIPIYLIGTGMDECIFTQLANVEHSIGSLPPPQCQTCGCPLSDHTGYPKGENDACSKCFCCDHMVREISVGTVARPVN